MGSSCKEIFVLRIEFLSAFEEILQENFHSTCGWMEINLHIHLVTTEDIIFDGMHALR